MSRTAWAVTALWLGVSVAAPVSLAARAASHARAIDAFAIPGFVRVLDSAFDDFYARRFERAQAGFARALRMEPANTLAMSFLDAAAAHRLGALDNVTTADEDDVIAEPRNYAAHVALGFAYLFESETGRERRQEARDEFEAARNIDPGAAGAHLGLGIMRFDERSAERAKLELLTALRRDLHDVLAREYLAELYQTDLRDPERALQYAIEVPNLVPHYADIDFHIGSLLCDVGHDAAAVTYLRRGLALDPSGVGEAGRYGRTLIARIEYSHGQYAAARRELEAALAANADADYARTLLLKVRTALVSPSPAPSDAASASPSAASLEPQ